MQSIHRRFIGLWILIWGAVCVSVFVSFSASVSAREPGEIWDLPTLRQTPPAIWSAAEEKTVSNAGGENQTILLQRVFYQGEPLEGRPTRIFAFVARPKGNGPFPGVVLVHGGGGTAFSEWAEIWAAHGYAAIAMDLAGCEIEGWSATEPSSPRRKMVDGGPGQSDDEKFQDFDANDYRKMWTYHAVADILRAHSLLDSLSYVDADRTAVTGISWGGYLTTMVAGIDDRFQVAVPVYGCGNLEKNSIWTERMEALSWPVRCLWNEYFDPNQYVGRARCPVFFLNGTDDLAYPMDIHFSSYEKVPGADVRLEIHMSHGHRSGWQPREIQAYVDSVLNGGKPLPCLENLRVERNADGSLTATADGKYIDRGAKAVSAKLHFTQDLGGRGILRQWAEQPATVNPENGRVTAEISAELAASSPLRLFLSVTDEAGNMVSSHYLLCRPETKPNFAPVPEGGVLLFGSTADGKLVNRFLNKFGKPADWPVQDGVMTVKSALDNTNHLHSDVDFQDAELHVEFCLPESGPGNSGIYIHGNYEMQIYNSFSDHDVHRHAAGALYSIQAPQTIAVLPPGTWQSYDIRYRAPRRDEAGNITEPGHLTAWLNGILVQNDTRFGEPVSVWHPFRHGTSDLLKKKAEQLKKTGFGPVFLQDHINPVQYRNVWIKIL